MPIYTEQVRENCIGEKCNEHTFLIKIDEHFISISAFMGTINELAQQDPRYTPVLAQLVQLKSALSSIAEIIEEQLSEPEKKFVKKIISKPVTCEIYVILHTAIRSQYYNLSEFIELYESKMAKAESAVEKAKYSNRVVKATIAQKIIGQINAALGTRAMTPKEREIRGYDLSEDQRVEKNVELLRGGLEKPEGVEAPMLTMGRYYDVPNMFQGHQIFAIDTLTGAIFWPGEIERYASFMSAGYEQQERDAITLDYIYGIQNPKKEAVIMLPENYIVLPLDLYIPNRSQLSAEARRVIARTEIELFTPCLGEMEKARKRVMDPKLIEKLLKLREHFEKHTE